MRVQILQFFELRERKSWVNKDRLTHLLQQIREGVVTVEEGLSQLRDFPAADLGFAKVDHQRSLRQGFPEIIYCPGKTVSQIVKIIAQLYSSKENILATRASVDIYRAVKPKFKKAVYYELARCIVVKHGEAAQKKGIVIITAGTADLPVAEEAAVTCSLLGQKPERLYDVGVAGIHRLFSEREKLAQAKVIIVVAGMEGALPSVVGGLVSVPVVAVPTSVGYGASFGGVAALLSMLNSCSPNVSVVNIDDGFGAGVVASLINK